MGSNCWNFGLWSRQTFTLSIIVIETFSKLFYEFREEKSESEKLDQMLIQLYRMISQDYQDKTSQAKYTSRKTRATDLQVMVIKRIKHIYYFILIVA